MTKDYIDKVREEGNGGCPECGNGFNENGICDNCSPTTENWRERFTRFYWETGEYKGRKLGIKVYIDFISSELLHQHKEDVERIIDELESNPNEDGSVSPNIQHFIEKKQTQLRKIINQLTIKE